MNASLNKCSEIQIYSFQKMINYFLIIIIQRDLIRDIFDLKFNRKINVKQTLRA